jgi:hypothetical protein
MRKPKTRNSPPHRDAMTRALAASQRVPSCSSCRGGRKLISSRAENNPQPRHMLGAASRDYRQLPSARAAFSAAPAGRGALAMMLRFWQRECREQSGTRSSTKRFPKETFYGFSIVSHWWTFACKLLHCTFENEAGGQTQRPDVVRQKVVQLRDPFPADHPVIGHPRTQCHSSLSVEQSATCTK